MFRTTAILVVAAAIGFVVLLRQVAAEAPDVSGPSGTVEPLSPPKADVQVTEDE
jgi:hypothetical protein